MATTPEEQEARFWELAEPMLDHAGVARSTVMDFPCPPAEKKRRRAL